MAVLTSGFRMMTPTCTIALLETSNRSSKVFGRTNVAASMPSHVPISGVLPSRPSRRASFLRFGVACSVRSPPEFLPLMSASPGDRGDHVVGASREADDDVRHERETAPDEQQRQPDLHGEAH